MNPKKYRIVIEFTASDATQAREIAITATAATPAKESSLVELQEEHSYFSTLPLVEVEEAKA